jgi:hypothetical protein
MPELHKGMDLPPRKRTTRRSALLSKRHGGATFSFVAAAGPISGPYLVTVSAEIGDAIFEHVAHRHVPVLPEADTRRRSGRQQAVAGGAPGDSDRAAGRGRRVPCLRPEPRPGDQGTRHAPAPAEVAAEARSCEPSVAAKDVICCAPILPTTIPPCSGSTISSSSPSKRPSRTSRSTSPFARSSTRTRSGSKPTSSSPSWPTACTSP